MPDELVTQQCSLKEISKVLRRPPYGPKEVHFLRHAIELSRGEGLDIRAGPLAFSAVSGPEWMNEGFFFAASRLLQVELLILKSDIGTGWFGRTKVQYACFCSNGNDHYHPVGVKKNLAMAFAKLTAIHKQYTS